jgi:hypothetical protein
MNTEYYWTGIADVTSNSLPQGAKGAVYRVLTFAIDHDMFAQKVTDHFSRSDDTLLSIESAEQLCDFLEHSWVADDHEIHAMMQTADRDRHDVICGGTQYYSEDDASDSQA